MQSACMVYVRGELEEMPLDLDTTARIEDIEEEVRKYNPEADLDLLRKGFEFAAKVHQGQERRSGESYLSHPLEVAKILAQLRMDAQTITAGLLHDAVEDTFATIEEIREVFGGEIADLVDGVTKLSNLPRVSHNGHDGKDKTGTPGNEVELLKPQSPLGRRADVVSETLRKTFLAMGDDVRVVDRTVDVHISKIREKLGSYGEYIETVKGVGYRFKA